MVGLLPAPCDLNSWLCKLLVTCAALCWKPLCKSQVLVMGTLSSMFHCSPQLTNVCGCAPG